MKQLYGSGKRARDCQQPRNFLGEAVPSPAQPLPDPSCPFPDVARNLQPWYFSLAVTISSFYLVSSVVVIANSTLAAREMSYIVGADLTVARETG